MRRIWLLAALPCLLSLAGPRPATAQSDAAQSARDTTVWRPLLDFVVTRLATHIAAAATGAPQKPWRMTFPTSGAPWPMVEAHLRTALRARRATPADSGFHVLEIGELRVSGDTAKVRLITGFTERCAGGRRGGYGNTEDVYVFRAGMMGVTFWSGARSDGVIHGDRFGC